MSAYEFWSHAGHPKAVEEPARSRSRSPEQWSKVPEDDAEPMVAETQKENTSDKQRSNLGIQLAELLQRPFPAHRLKACRMPLPIEFQICLGLVLSFNHANVVLTVNYNEWHSGHI